MYTPGGVIDVDDQGLRDLSLSGCPGSGAGTNCYHGVNYPVFNRGGIMRSLRFHGYKLDPTYHGPAIACNGGPCNGGTIPTERQLTLTAYVCPTASPCTASTPGAMQRITATVVIPLDASTPPQITKW